MFCALDPNCRFTDHTIQDAHFQGSALFQAANITKTNNERNNLTAAGWVLPAT